MSEKYSLPETEVVILYKNWRGERGFRHIRPIEIVYMSTEWHPEAQWLLRAFDLDKEAMRDFALGDIESWDSAE